MNREVAIRQMEGREAVAPEEAALQKAAFSGEVNFEQLDVILASAEKTGVASEAFRKILATKLGQERAARLLESGTAGLKTLQDNLRARIVARPGQPESGAPLLEQADLEKLLVIQEVLGSEPQLAAQAFDLSAFRPAENLEIIPDISGIEIEGQKGKERVSFSFSYNKDDRVAGLVTRSFSRAPSEKGGPRRLIVVHDWLTLAKDLQGNGIAEELSRRSLKAYDELKVDEIKLTATEVGSYAWAKHGFDWDMEAMREKEGGAKGEIARIIRETQDNARRNLAKLGILEDDPRARDVLAQYDALVEKLERGEEVKPKELAEAGTGIDIAVDENHNIFMADDSRAVQQGLRPMRIGQYSMIGVNWPASMKLSRGPGGEKSPQGRPRWEERRRELAVI